MDPLSLQMQLRNNSKDLNNFCDELKEWGAEMSRKDDLLKKGVDPNTNVPLPRAKLDKAIKPNEEKPVPKKKKRMKVSDYSAWEKYDADAECAKLDDEELARDDSDLSDEFDENAREEAIYEKEKGNKFVNKQNWDQAIACYTKAINHYSHDPVFYANRALCYLKKQNYPAAEVDCTVAIQLDKTYVKAYQRRAAAREALNQLTDAHNDLLKIFDYEPNNKESKAALKKLENKLEKFNQSVKIEKKPEVQRPISKFTMSTQNNATKQKQKSSVTEPVEERTVTETPKIGTYWPSGNEVELIQPVKKAPHLRSKKPLKRIVITEIDGTNTAEPWPRPGFDNKVIRCDELKIVERRREDFDNKTLEETKSRDLNKNKKEDTKENLIEFKLSVPDTSIQFGLDWRLLHDKPGMRYKYLKQVNPKNFATLFKESLDSELFSGIVGTLANYFVTNKDPVDGYLLGLSEVKRFEMLTMFMSEEDQNNIKKLGEYMQISDITNDVINNLMKKFGI